MQIFLRSFNMKIRLTKDHKRKCRKKPADCRFLGRQQKSSKGDMVDVVPEVS